MRIQHASTIITVGCCLTLIAQAAVLWLWQSEARVLEVAAEKIRREMDAGAEDKPSVPPLPEVDAHEAVLRSTLWPEYGAILRSPPPDRSAAFLDLLHFRQEMKSLALAKGIPGSEAGFGFRDYAHSGPEPIDGVFVHRQREAAGHVLQLLFAASPQRWLGLRRSPPPSIQAGDARKRSDASLDLFDPPPPLVPSELASSLSFELRFSGRTDVLRRFLNALVGGAKPVFIRAVDVSRSAAIPPTENANAIDQQETEFRVVIDWVEPAA